MADNASDTAAGQDRDTAGGPTGDNTESDGQVKAPQASSEQGQGGSGRGRSGLRDMLMSMIALVIVVLVLAAISHSCSFSPGGPSVNSSSPPVDIKAELETAAGQVHFPLREPTLPAGWHPNSDSMDGLGPKGADQAVRIGVLTANGHYLQVSQSDATAQDLVRSASGLDAAAPVQPMGTETVNGTKWTVYPGIRSEMSWVTDLGTERLFVTGNGSTSEFNTLAAATLTGKRVSPADGP